MKDENSGCGANGRDFSEPGMIVVFDDLRQQAVGRPRFEDCSEQIQLRSASVA
jgi:hypothetical protein